MAQQMASVTNRKSPFILERNAASLKFDTGGRSVDALGHARPGFAMHVK
jgi:hypothetical protein